jgi:hypothetical protein
MRLNAVMVTAATVIFLSPASAEFTGDLKLGPPGCQKSGLCELLEDLRYRDPGNYQWVAAKGLKTDGASIPWWGQPIVGAPFDEAYLKAAVIHDHYCVRQVRSWRETHRVFYHAMRTLGVPETKAKLMYYAVYLGGPKWVDLMPGNDCGGKNCINSIDIDGNILLQNRGKPVKFSRPAQYDAKGFDEEVKLVEALLAQQGGQIDLETLEARAHSKRPSDMFYKLPEGTTFGGGLAIQ